jgi:hypothetical protein
MARVSHRHDRLLDRQSRQSRRHLCPQDVPGEFRSLTEALRCDQLAVTLIRIPPHSDFEQGSGHRHEEIEEVYLVDGGEKVEDFWEASSEAAQHR